MYVTRLTIIVLIDTIRGWGGLQFIIHARGSIATSHKTYGWTAEVNYVIRLCNSAARVMCGPLPPSIFEVIMQLLNFVTFGGLLPGRPLSNPLLHG